MSCRWSSLRGSFASHRLVTTRRPAISVGSARTPDELISSGKSKADSSGADDMAPRFVGYGGLLGDAFRRGTEADERVVELRMDRQDLSEAEEFERACRCTAVCHDGETGVVGSSLGQLDQQSDTHRSEEINPAEVDNQSGDVGVEKC